MSLQNKAESIFKEVRERYQSSPFKSTNKQYDLDVIPEAARSKRAHRNEMAANGGTGHSEQRIRVNAHFMTLPPAGRSASAQVGESLWKLQASILNCDELSQMACYRAAEANVPANLMNLNPSDHALCVLGEMSAINAIDGTKVSALVNLPASIDAYAVDVWLNIVCPIREYPAKVSAKLDKWAQVGKRVMWVPDPDKDEERWDVPNMSYRDAFLASKLGKDF